MMARSRRTPNLGNQRGSAVAWILILGLSGCVTQHHEETDAKVIALLTAGDDSGWDRAPLDGELVYAAQRLTDANKQPIALDEIGSMDPEIAQRVARPYTYKAEPFVYDEEAFSREEPKSGGTIDIYRVVKRENLDRIDPIEPTLAPPHIADEVYTLATANSQDPLLLYGKLRNFPEWDVPLRVGTYQKSPTDTLALEETRSARIAQRQALLEQRSADLRSAVVANGGKYVTGFHATGWVAFELPGDRLYVLERQEQFAKFEAEDYSLTLGDNWDLGTGRRSDRQDADRFLAAGYNGGQANSDRHSFGRMTLSVIEPGMLENEACTFYDGANCTGTSRIQELFECRDADGDGNLCEPTANFPDSDSYSAEGWSSDHGTRMASIALGDYTDNQACGFEVGDTAWTSGCHANSWENLRTGMAPESALIYFGFLDQTNQAKYTDAIDDSIDRNVDVISASWMKGSAGDCNMFSSSIIEDEIEAAFDDGILPVFCAGNNSGATASSCNLSAPGDTPKALAINPYDTDPSACENDTTDCLLVQTTVADNGARGGLDVLVDSTWYANSAAGVALIAPSRLESVTSHAGSYGGVAGSGGCSTATPHVAGLALLVKDWMVARGSSWINSPGRLATVMLGMGDGHRANSGTATSTFRGTTGSNDWYGFGRPRLRLFQNGEGYGPWAFNMRTTTLYWYSANLVEQPFGSSPLGSGTEIVKCTMMQHEDMSSKSATSDIDMTVEIVNCSNPNQVYYTRSSTSVDPNTMVAIRADEGKTLDGRCVEVTYTPDTVLSGGVTFSSWCYAAGVNDDEEP